ncbi:Fe(3+)-hydroxamate ABC transporter permease FhuB [Paraburkholderia xenovorans]|uniref:Fe(3+)-hydroxamate ABC transporter permease FhuB n=1 Tax=Paraburkholderia xenovorans TaxID=36873 RepID=UPI0038BC9CA2
MKSATATVMKAPPRTPLPLLCAVLACAALLFFYQLGTHLPASLWWQAIVAPSPTDLQQLLVHDSALPRIAVTWLCGAALGLAGVATQQVLRNVLAEPMTLGVFPGAYLALSAATVFAPHWLAAGRDVVALAGAGAALATVFALAARRGMSPLALVLAGMIVNLCCGALSFALSISHYDVLTGLMIWGGGSFDQHDWHVAFALLARLAPCVGLLLLCMRPLTIFEVGDAVAGSLGVSLRFTRGAVLLLTLLVTAFVVSEVGVVGFIGLAGPTLARLAGARRLRDRMVWAPLFGAALLWLADEASQPLSALYGTVIPTGAITTLLGAPLLLAMLPRLHGTPDLARAARLHPAPLSRRRLTGIASTSAVALLIVALVSLSVGRGLNGWHISNVHEMNALLFLRLPHVVAAAAVGVLLALAGGIVQRMTGNPMASPDLLGITAGGALGLIGALFLTTGPGVPTFFVWCAGGAFVTLAALFLLSRSSSYSPDTLVLTGVTISALFQAVSTIAMASNDPRVLVLYGLLAGSTYNVSAFAAAVVAVIALCSLAVVPLCRRWLDVLPLGANVSTALGVNVTRARLWLLLLASLMTAAATLVIGPLSFIGLMAPHMTRMLGIRRPLALLFVSALLGAVLMVFSDWLGRWILFPQEMPAGVMATMTGGFYLIVTMLRRNRDS